MLVYLDSNVYIDADYVFDREEFLTLRDLMRKGKLQILYTIDTAGRVNEQIETDIRRATSTYNRYLRKYMGPFRKNENYGIREISADAAVEELQADFRKLLAEEGMVQIPLDPVSADRLISDYYGGLPPFENKRALGFQDAIVINALRNYARAKDLICVVSKDEEFRNAFENDKNFLPFSSLDSFIRFLQETQDDLVDLADKLKEIISQGQMNEGIEKYIYSLDIVRECDSKVGGIAIHLHKVVCIVIDCLFMVLYIADGFPGQIVNELCPVIVVLGERVNVPFSRKSHIFYRHCPTGAFCITGVVFIICPELARLIAQKLELSIGILLRNSGFFQIIRNPGLLQMQICQVFRNRHIADMVLNKDMIE